MPAAVNRGRDRDMAKVGTDGTEHMREEAREDAEIRVRALLQTFALPSVDEDMIHKLLVDSLANAEVAGYARGWDDALATAATAVENVTRFRP